MMLGNLHLKAIFFSFSFVLMMCTFLIATCDDNAIEKNLALFAFNCGLSLTDKGAQTSQRVVVQHRPLVANCK